MFNVHLHTFSQLIGSFYFFYNKKNSKVYEAKCTKYLWLFHVLKPFLLLRGLKLMLVSSLDYKVHDRQISNEFFALLHLLCRVFHRLGEEEKLAPIKPKIINEKFVSFCFNGAVSGLFFGGEGRGAFFHIIFPSFWSFMPIIDSIIIKENDVYRTPKTTKKNVS